MHPLNRLLPGIAGLAALLATSPAKAQQYWLPNGPGGTTWNNPQGSLTGTMNEHILQRHMWQRQYSQHPAMRQQQQQGGGGAAPASIGGDPTFRLNNASGVTLQELYVSSAENENWGPDRLGRQVLPGGRAFVVRLPMGQCVNDIRAVFANGRAVERRQVDTCALTDVNLP